MTLIDKLNLTEDEKINTIYALKRKTYQHLHTLGMINNGLLNAEKEARQEKEARKDCQR